MYILHLFASNSSERSKHVGDHLSRGFSKDVQTPGHSSVDGQVVYITEYPGAELTDNNTKSSAIVL